MAEARLTDQWTRTALVRADMQNLFRERPIAPEKLLPKWIRDRLPKPPPPKPFKAPIEILKTLFVERR